MRSPSEMGASSISSSVWSPSDDPRAEAAGDGAIAKDTFLPLFTAAGVMRSPSEMGASSISSSVWSPSDDPRAEAAGDGAPSCASWRKSVIRSKTSDALYSLRPSNRMLLLSVCIVTCWLTRYLCLSSKYICCRWRYVSRCSSK